MERCGPLAPSGDIADQGVPGMLRDVVARAEDGRYSPIRCSVFELHGRIAKTTTSERATDAMAIKSADQELGRRPGDPPIPGAGPHLVEANDAPPRYQPRRRA